METLLEQPDLEKRVCLPFQGSGVLSWWRWDGIATNRLQKLWTMHERYITLFIIPTLTFPKEILYLYPAFGTPCIPLAADHNNLTLVQRRALISITSWIIAMHPHETNTVPLPNRNMTSFSNFTSHNSTSAGSTGERERLLAEPPKIDPHT